MTANSTDTRQSMECPPLEDIAAFIDDTLSPEERARVTGHLARCESCYEVFSGAVHFQLSAKDTGGGGVRKFPLGDIPRWLPLAASVVLATGYMLWQSSSVIPDVTAAGLVESLQGQPGITAKLYHSEVVERGAGDEGVSSFSAAPLFLTGVYLLDLRLSAQAGDVRDTQNVFSSLFSALDQVLGMHSEATLLKKETDGLTDAAALRRAAEKWERNLQSSNAEDPFFRFGLWTEAGRLSAKTRSPKFFEQRINRRFLAGIQREISSLDDARYAPVLEDLQRIEALWDRNELNVQDYAKLEDGFRSVIEQMEKILKQDQIDESDPDLPG